MATFDKSGTKRIVDFFETIGYPVQFINVNDDSKNYDKFVLLNRNITPTFKYTSTIYQ